MGGRKALLVVVVGVFMLLLAGCFFVGSWFPNAWGGLGATALERGVGENSDSVLVARSRLVWRSGQGFVTEYEARNWNALVLSNGQLNGSTVVPLDFKPVGISAHHDHPGGSGPASSDYVLGEDGMIRQLTSQPGFPYAQSPDPVSLYGDITFPGHAPGEVPGYTVIEYCDITFDVIDNTDVVFVSAMAHPDNCPTCVDGIIISAEIGFETTTQLGHQVGSFFGMAVDEVPCGTCMAISADNEDDILNVANGGVVYRYKADVVWSLPEPVNLAYQSQFSAGGIVRDVASNNGVVVVAVAATGNDLLKSYLGATGGLIQMVAGPVGDAIAVGGTSSELGWSSCANDGTVVVTGGGDSTVWGRGMKSCQ